MTGGTVVVLGPTGRNFAAGMSGGVAYVLDDDQAARSRINAGTVGIDELNAEDREALGTLVEEHVAHTRSSLGRGILATWARRRFVKIVPHEWRRVLELRRAG